MRGCTKLYVYVYASCLPLSGSHFLDLLSFCSIHSPYTHLYRSLANADLTPPTVVHTGDSVESISSYLSATPSPKIVCAMMGGGFTYPEFEAVLSSCEFAKKIPWIRPKYVEPGSAGRPPGSGPPSAQEVSQWGRGALLSVKEKLLRGDAAEGEVWWI